MGVSAAHDSSLCFYKNGKIEYFIKEERVTRQKRDKTPIRSLYNFDTNDDVVYCFGIPTINSYWFLDNERFAAKKYNIVKSFDTSNEHHLIHANLAFYDSGFDTALVFVVDRNGSVANVDGNIYDTCRESESVYIASYPNIFTPIYKNYWVYGPDTDQFIKKISVKYPDCDFVAKSEFSITKVYETATSLIMQDMLENGKTMGLSAYGDKDLIFDNFFNIDSIPEDSLFGHEYRDDVYYSTGNYAINSKLNKISKKNIDSNNYKQYADYAWQVQKQTQEALANLVQKYVEKTGINNVCITGGYGLNVVANHYLISQFPDINFFFEPLADDSGNSIGAAMKIYRDETLDNNKYPLKNTFFNGSIYNLSKIKGKTVSVSDVAQIIANKKSVAVYQGLAEAGPRALGNRSILFDARDKNAKEKVNTIKKREWYRPFACMVLKNDAKDYFDMGKLENSPYMTISFPVIKSKIDTIPGVVHVDDTCRIQTIDESNTNIFELLLSFKEITGIGVILNTSFNLAGEPLVETPEDAIETLKNSCLDYIWFPERSLLVSKEDLN